MVVDLDKSCSLSRSMPVPANYDITSLLNIKPHVDEQSFSPQRKEHLRESPLNIKSIVI